MDDQPEVIRQEMEETRSHLADKLEALETQVTEKVEATTSAVSGTVEAVKETVESVTESVKETVANVGQAFNLRLQTERHPWAIFGGSVALGCLAGRMLGSSRNEERYEEDNGHFEPLYRQEYRESAPSWRREEEPSRQQTQPSEPAHTERKGWLWDEVSRLKGLALGALMGVVRDMAKRGLPGSFGERIAEEVEHLNSHLGGETIRGSLFSNEK